MATFLNHVAIAAPRNGATTHSVTPSSANVGTTAIGTGVVAGTVAAGTLFTPTAGRLLVCFVDGSATSSTPTGWTLPTGGSVVNNTGIYGWYRIAAGGDTITTTHNGSNFPVVFHFLEFASGSTFVSANAASGVSASGGAGPSLTSLTGTNWIAGAVGQAGTGAVVTTTWSTGVELVDTSVITSGTTGYTYSLTYLEDSVLTTASAAATMAGNSTDTTERLMFAVRVAVRAPRRRVALQAVNRAINF